MDLPFFFCIQRFQNTPLRVAHIWSLKKYQNPRNNQKQVFDFTIFKTFKTPRHE